MLNSDKSCGTDVGLASVLDQVTANNPSWTVLFLPEFDGYSRDVLPPASEHLIFRHYPGEGSWAIAWAINNIYRDHVRSIDWLGRAGSILLEAPARMPHTPSTSLYLVGFHGAHGDALADSLTDVATLVKRKPRHSQLLICADWNIDLLPTLQDDPWCALPHRSEHHCARRQILDSFCASLRLWNVIPARVESPCGGPFGELSLQVPFTRIPTGESAGCSIPSLLDYWGVSQDIIEDSWIDWLSSGSDHGLVMALVRGNAKSLRPQQGHWHCGDWFTCFEWMQNHGAVAESFDDAAACTAFFLNAQEALADVRSCSQRRRDRVPDHIRRALMHAPACPDERDRQAYKVMVGRMFREHRETMQAERNKYVVRTGRVFQKVKEALPH